jgi:hypothetical protein
MANHQAQRGWAQAFGKALQDSNAVPELANMFNNHDKIILPHEPTEIISILKGSTALTDNFKALLNITHGLIQQITILEGDLDTTQQSLATSEQCVRTLISQLQPQQERASTHRLSTNPDKFTGMEQNITKRHQSYVTFEDKVVNCIEQDSHVFNNEFQRIHFIGGLLANDAYETVRDGLRTVKTNTDPTTWRWPTHTELLKYLHSIYATIDLTWDAKMQLDKLTMGTTPFPNFLSSFNRLADRCKYQPVQKVEALKLKVTQELLSNAILKGVNLGDDNYTAWCDLFQNTWKGMETIQHFKSMSDNKKKGTIPQPQHPQTPPSQTLQVNLPVTPNPDAMDLSAMRQGTHTQNAMRPPPGVDAREWCIKNRLCFYCKKPGHSLGDCNDKKTADQKRAQGQLPPRYPNTRNQPVGYQANGFQANGFQRNGFQYNGGFQPNNNYHHDPMQNRAIGFVDTNSVYSSAPASPTLAPTLTPSQSISRANTPSYQGN